MVAKKQGCHSISPADKQINEEMVHPTSHRASKEEFYILLGRNRKFTIWTYSENETSICVTLWQIRMTRTHW